MLGLELSRAGLHAAIRACREHVARGLGGYACFVNVHSLTESESNPSLRGALERATFRFADGRPLVWLSQLDPTPIEGRVAGPDFMREMLRDERVRVHGLIGSTPDRLTTIARTFELSTISYSPPMRPFSPADAIADWEAFLDRCPGRVPPAFVWVGLGAPKQELWMATVSPHAPTTMFFGVGAAFDFLSGAKQRAPRWAQSVGLEWAHRLASDPRRLWRRYLVTNTLFVARVVRELRDHRADKRSDEAT